MVFDLQYVGLTYDRPVEQHSSTPVGDTMNNLDTYDVGCNGIHSYPMEHTIAFADG